LSTYLLEIGTEELPAKFADEVINQFKALIEFEFDKSFIKYDEIFCSTTPRRIVLLISGIIDDGKDKIELRKGPRSEAAFLDGKPTKAAIGFAKSLNLNIEDLKIKNTIKGDFVFGETVVKGQSAKDLISLNIPKILKSIQGQRFMKWGVGNFRFSRPIRWVVSLYNDEILNFSLENINSDLSVSRNSRGHRLFGDNVEISSPDEYFNILNNNGVVVIRDNRKLQIKSLVTNISNELKVNPDMPEDLLNELTDLVEFPNLIVGSFHREFLSLPCEVLCTVMKSHQRYIPLFKENVKINKLDLDSQNVLSTNFLCISNGLKKSSDLIKYGNENVIKARFTDAKFFLESDKKLSCKVRNQKISKISYLRGLGNLFDKVTRIEFISSQIFKMINDKTINHSYLKDSARYSKHDLCSEVVCEFPELQGLMAGKYLKNEGFNDHIALAVAEHYLPRFSNDILPSTKYGAITSISDKLETVISIFVIGKRPTGSSDPFALRRNMNGLIQIIWYFEFNLKLDQIIIKSIEFWKNNLKNFQADYENVLSEILLFSRQRIITHLEDLSYKKDIIDSLCNSKNLDDLKIFNIIDLKKRIKTIERIKSLENADSIINIISRISKLANSGNLNTNVYSVNNLIDSNLFEKKCESKLFELIKDIEILITSNNWKYEEIVSAFANNLKILEDIFDPNDGVLIMSDNLQVRANRLNLLGLLRNYSLLIADFTILNF